RGRAAPIVVDADGSPGVTDEVTPTDADAGLDRDARLDLGRDDGIFVALVLLVEPLPTRHRYHSCLDVLLRKQLLGGHNVLHLGAGSDQDHIGGSVAVLEGVPALGDLRSIGKAVLATREDGDGLPGEGQPGRSVVVLQDRRPGGGGLVRVGRTDHIGARGRPWCGGGPNRYMRGAVLPPSLAR